jgi:hypothetical protein
MDEEFKLLKKRYNVNFSFKQFSILSLWLLAKPISLLLGVSLEWNSINASFIVRTAILMAIIRFY